MALHTDPITERCSSRKGTCRINGENPYRSFLLTACLNETVNNSALPCSRRPGNPNDLGLARIWENMFYSQFCFGDTIFYVSYKAGGSPNVTRLNPLSSLHYVLSTGFIFLLTHATIVSRVVPGTKIALMPAS